MTPRSTHRRLALAHVAATLALVTATLATGPARAQEPQPDTGGAAIGRLFDALGVRSKRAEPADFVQSTRSPSGDYGYAPLPAPHRAEPRKKSTQEMEAIGAELDSAAAGARARAARVKIPDVAPTPGKKANRR